MRNILFGLSLVFVSLSTQANYENALHLINACEKSSDPKMSEAFSESSCIGYIGGVLDGAQVVFSLKPTSRLFCVPPSGVSPETALSKIKAWAESNPSLASQGTGRMAIFVALAQSYPCN